MKVITVSFLVTIASQSLTASELITFNSDKIGVNFGGYHASVGLGGLLSGGAKGGLYAEAGTPFGQSAAAGLGGAVGNEGHSTGALYAGATAGGNIKASAGLGGGVSANNAAGIGVASAQAGGHYAGHILGGDSSVQEEIKPVTVLVNENTEDRLHVKPLHKKNHIEFNFDAANEVKSVPVTQAVIQTDVSYEPKSFVKEVTYVKTPVIKEKHIHRVHHKPSRHHLRKTAYIGGYVGSDLGTEFLQAPSKHVIIESDQPVISKRIDTEIDSAVQANENSHVQSNGGQVTYKKQVTFEKSPTFFSDIFNIPISALKAVGDLFGNTAKSTSISIQKSASVNTDAESVTPHRQPSSSSVSSSSDAHVSIETPSASKVFDDILSIPINTLGAVSKFLENNVPARKRVEVTEDGVGEPTRIRLGAKRHI